MPTSTTSSFVQASLECYKWPEKVVREEYQVAANQVIPQGGIVAQLTGANTDEVWSLVGASAVGTFTITVGNALQQITTALTAASLTAAAVQAALNAAFAQLCPSAGTTGFVTVTGSWNSGGTGTITVTFNNGTANTGPLSSNPQTLGVLNTGSITGGSVSLTETTKGINNGAIVNYNNATVANPTTAPGLTAAGADGTWAVGAYTVAYTYVTAAGESIPSYESSIAVASTNHIAVASITGIPAGVTSVNVYVNGLFAKNQAVTSNATGNFNLLAPAAATAATPPPKASTAFSNNDGSQIPIGAAWFAMASGPDGQITFGASSPIGNEHKPRLYTGNVAIAGYFPCANLFVNSVAGLDQNTVTTLGRLISGSLSTGNVVFTGA